VPAVWDGVLADFELTARRAAAAASPDVKEKRERDVCQCRGFIDRGNKRSRSYKEGGKYRLL
jgi:hypothetical protein